MRLNKLRIKNFRCFGEEVQEIKIDKITAFIGHNSSGKTAALAAINYLFSPNSAERVLKRSDFHIPFGKNPEDIQKQELFIEAIFVFDELNSGDSNGASIPIFFNSMVVDEPGGDPYLRIRLDATWEKSQSVEGAIEQKVNFVICPVGQEVGTSFKTAPRKILDRIRYIYIPATRDTARQLKNVSGTMMSYLIKCFNWSKETLQEVTESILDLNSKFLNAEGVQIVDSSIKNQWKDYDFDSRYYNAELRFGGTDIDTILKKIDIVFEPTESGRAYTVNEMGDGLRSLFYISMVDSILKVENNLLSIREYDGGNISELLLPVITIIAVEEPENHISPHILGKLINNLKNISSSSNAQILITSHSSSIVKRIEPESIRHFRLNSNACTSVRPIKLPKKDLKEEYTYVKEAIMAYPELYFAQLVVLGEGDTEEILLNKFIENMEGNIDSCGISIVPLGGRFVNHFWRLLSDLKIPYITLIDLDREREKGGWERIKYIIDQLKAIGYSLEQIQMNGTPSDENALEKFLQREDDEDELMEWVIHLEKFNVYFSAPLDFDFMMLEKFKEEYLSTLSSHEGPHGVAKGSHVKSIGFEAGEKWDKKYSDKVGAAVKAVLKNDNKQGGCYTDEQRELMIWYKYFFLNRSKPATHMLMLSKIDDVELAKRSPDTIRRLCKKIGELLT